MKHLFAALLLFGVGSCSDPPEVVQVRDHSISMPTDVHGVKGVYEFPNLTRVEIRDPGAKVTIKSNSGGGLAGLRIALEVELASGAMHTVSDKRSGNGELEFDGETVKGRYFVLEASGRFDAIEAPTPDRLEMFELELKKHLKPEEPVDSE